MMTWSEAMVELNRPLVFGDKRQIEARDYVCLLCELRERMAACRYCRGAGFTRRRRDNKAMQCICIRREPKQVKEDLGLYREMSAAENGGQDARQQHASFQY